MGIVDLIELDNEVRVEIDEDADSIDEPLQNFEGSLGLDNGGLTEGLLEVVDDLDVTFFCLLEVFSLPLTHGTKCNLYIFITFFLSSLNSQAHYGNH